MYNLSVKLSLVKALRMQTPSCVAFVGAGGKTTTIFKLARELSTPVIVTATTHLGVWQTELADKHIVTMDTLPPAEQLKAQLNGVVLFTGDIKDNRTQPVSNEVLAWLHSFCQSHSVTMLIEADGSRQKPLKAWADHEPPIPDFVDQVVQVIGMSGLGYPLTDNFVHRPGVFSTLSGLKMGETITSKSLEKVLTSPDGGLKNIPARAKKSLILNQVEDHKTQSIAHSMKDNLLKHFSSVLVTNMNDNFIHAIYEPIAAIILAAGEASRFGEPKQLLQWKGIPFVRAVAQTAIQAGLSPVVVVTGAHAEQVEGAIRDLDVNIVQNQDWKSGQGSSIRQGVMSLPKEVGGAVFLLVDQPQVNTSILHALKEKHAQGLYSIIAPMVIDRRANPVLFGRVTFADLMNIEGDTGGRAIFHKHRVEYIPWHDENLLWDVDTPEQYKKIISNKDL